MSAFLVADTTINKILTHFDREIRRSDWLEEKCESELSINVDEEWQTKLGQRMWDFNQLSLGYRYGDEKQDLSYHFSPAPCTLLQAFKALQCWMYQCCEGDIPNNSRLYRFFSDVVRPHLAEAIIMGTAEYDEAEWG